MAKKKPKGEMPFLDHLEELRWRILWSGGALVVGSIIGFYLVTRFDIPALLMVPIQPYLSGDRLIFTHPTDAFLITLKLSVVVGAVLAFPVIVRQVWGFLSPALYERERRLITPAAIAGVGLFLIGGFMAYLWVLPAVLRMMLSPRFLGSAFEAFITAGEYFRFATQVILAFGFVFQLPLVMVLLAAIGLVDPRFFARNRHYAFVIGALVAAFVTPPDVFSMLLMMAPIIVLYEVGILIGRVVWKRNGRGDHTIGGGGGGGGGALILLGLCLATPAEAQDRPPDSTRTVADSLQAVQDSARTDSLSAAADSAGPRVELPTAPSRSFPSADSLIEALLNREGYRATRYAADSLTFLAMIQQIDLQGSAIVEREGRIVEADSIRFMQALCALAAMGDPKLFDGGTVLVGEEMDYDTCERRGIVSNAITTFNQAGVTWYMRGDIGVDSGSTRLYAGRGNITSSDLPNPDYHFRMGRMKWVTNNIMVARPVVLYVRDVPVLWLPFLFQDMRRGRRTGMLTPRFGINDIVRPNQGYRRHITNVGYFFAFNDYTDGQVSLDWFAETTVSINGQVRYRWLNQFLDGGIGVSRVFEAGSGGNSGRRTTRLAWNHRQQFNQRTRLTANVDFSTSTRVLRENAVDPFLQTGQLRSTINFSKQLDWGTITAGGSRVQQISNEVVNQTFPDIRLTPVPISIGTNLTWSPSFSFQRRTTSNQPAGVILLPPLDGLPQEDSLFNDSRRTSLSLGTPLRIGRWNWQNSFTVTDVLSNARTVVSVADPTDTSRTFTRVYGEDFSTEIEWNTGINLPMVFPGSWKLQPSVGIRNKTAGPFLLRNRFTGGEFVQQGKRPSFAAGISPAFFGFFPGVGPISRIRHSVTPQFSWSYAPSAQVTKQYLLARNPSNPNPNLKSPALHRVGLSGISQTFEGKFGSSDDSTDTQSEQKIKLLSWQTSGLQYDFEQAKEPGRNGWITSSISNSFTSDMLRGFNLRVSHDLWDGRVGFDSTRFDPFLRSVSASFTISGSTFARLARALFGGEPLPPPAAPEELPADSLDQEFFSPAPVMATGRSFPTVESIAGRGRRGQGFTAAIRYNERRTRLDDNSSDSGTPLNNRNVGVTMSFSPTRNWSLQWTTDYNLTTKEFGSNALRFERDLRRWRATFAFVQAPNGNFAFNFFVQLLDLTELKFNYDQRSVNR